MAYVGSEQRNGVDSDHITITVDPEKLANSDLAKNMGSSQLDSLKSLAGAERDHLDNSLGKPLTEPEVAELRGLINASGAHEQVEALIRKPIKELVDELDPRVFWQIHRSTLVNVKAIAGVTRDFRGRQIVSVRGHPEKLEVSRSYTGLFKGM